MTTRRSVLLLSGGLDSAVALWWARREGLETVALTLGYNNRAERERDAARKIARAGGVARHVEADVGFLKESGDLRGESAGTRLERSDTEGTYIPARNTIFYGIAAYYAEIAGAEAIVGGHTREDGALFPDASAKFFEALNTTLELGTEVGRAGRLRIVQPLIALDKAGVVRLGSELGVPMHLTWSCHGTAATPCGTCRGCMARAKGFAEAGVPDPALSKK